MDFLYKLFFVSFAGSIFFYFFDISFLINVIFLLLFIVAYFIPNLQMYKTVILLVAFFIFFGVSYNILITREKLEPGKIYFISGNLNGKKIEVIKLNGKYHLKKIYFNVAKSDIPYLRNGRYKFKINLKKIEESKNYFGEVEILSYETNIFNNYRNYIRNKFFEMLYKYDSESFAFIKATLLAENDYIDKELNEKFKYSGVSHILVISGSHIAIIIFIILKIMGIFNFGYRTKYIIAGGIITLYCLILGFSESISRAYFMGIIFILSKIFFEENDVKKSLAVSFIITSIINPVSFFSISFQLSYLAVVAMVFIYPMFSKFTKNIILEILFLSLSVQILLTPVFFLYFHKIPLFSFLVNIIAVPLGELIIQISFISFVVSIIFSFAEPVLGYILNFLISLFYFYVNLFSNFPLLQITYYEKVSLLFVIVFYIAIFIFLIKKEFFNKNRIIVTITVLVLSFFIDFSNIPDKYKLKNSLFLKTSLGKSIFILNDNLNETDIFNLKDSGIKEIDVIFLPNENKKNLLLNKVFKVKNEYIINHDKKAEFENFVVENIKGKLQILNY